MYFALRRGQTKYHYEARLQGLANSFKELIFTSNLPSVGLGKQSAFGTAAASLAPLKVTAVDPQLVINRVENDELFGSISKFAPEQGTMESTISAEGRAYPVSIGHLLQMIAGAPTTTSDDDVYTHVFKPSDVLPPRYTVGLSETNGISTKVLDVLASSLELTQEVGDVLKWSLDGIGTDRTTGTVTISGSPETGRAFRFDDLTATVNADTVVNFKSLTITVSNPVSNIFTLNGTNSAAAQEFTGRRDVEVSGTLRFVNDAASYRSQFENNTSMALSLAWDIDVDTSLTIDIPDFRIDQHNWSRGFEETEVDFSGGGYVTPTGAIIFTLSNTQTSY